MVAQRTEAPRATTEEKRSSREPQATEAEAAPPQTKASPLKAWLPLAAALLLLPLLSYAMTTFVLVPRMQKALRLTGAAEATPAPHAEGEGAEKASEGHGGGQKQNVAMNKLLVNVAGTMGSRYLLTSMTLMGKAAEFTGKISENEPQLRDMASGLLSSKTIADLEKPGARNVIRGELLAGFNSILGNGVVQEIYFTEFAIQ